MAAALVAWLAGASATDIFTTFHAALAISFMVYRPVGQ
jgi:hypothetical protein